MHACLHVRILDDSWMHACAAPAGRPAIREGNLEGSGGDMGVYQQAPEIYGHGSGVIDLVPVLWASVRDCATATRVYALSTRRRTGRLSRLPWRTTVVVSSVAGPLIGVYPVKFRLSDSVAEIYSLWFGKYSR